MDPSEPRKERRLDARDIVLKEATIIAGDLKLNCSIRNQHANGAELRVAPDAQVPDRFLLHVPADDATYRVVVRWRRTERLGVQFYGSQ